MRSRCRPGQRAWPLPGALLGATLACGGCALSPWQLDGHDGPAPASPFTRLDSNRDGYLSPAEFGSGPDARLDGDADGDGRLDFTEFQAWLPTRMRVGSTPGDG